MIVGFYSNDDGSRGFDTISKHWLSRVCGYQPIGDRQENLVGEFLATIRSQKRLNIASHEYKIPLVISKVISDTHGAA